MVEQAGCSRDGQVNSEAARIRALEKRSAEVRTSTFPQCGASGAAPSLTPTRPTAFLRQRPAGAERLDSVASTSQGLPGRAETRPWVRSQPARWPEDSSEGWKPVRGSSCRHSGGLQAMRYPFRWRLNHRMLNRWPPSPCILLTDPRTYFNLVILTSIQHQDTPESGVNGQIRSLAPMPASARPAASTARTASASTSLAAATAGSRDAVAPPKGSAGLASRLAVQASQTCSR